MFNVSDLLRLSTIPRVGVHKFRSLVNHFNDPAAVFRASPRELARVPGINKILAAHIARQQPNESFVRDQLQRINKTGVRIISLWDKEYPALLRNIYDPPPFLYVLGALSPPDSSCIAVVGTRKPSPYGRRVAECFAKGLVPRGIAIASGLARGIDTIAHEAALEAGGRTYAVVGSGLDVPYPPENKRLAQRIASSGFVVSEFPMGTKPDPQNFPRRNRIISGLSLGVIVIESDEDGGAMITATSALDQNREVFAVPGSIFEQRSTGTHTLIQTGQAKLVRDIDDVLAELQSRLHLPDTAHALQAPPPALTFFEKELLDHLTDDPVHIDILSDITGIGISDALVSLLSLEFKGLVRQLPGKVFRRR